MSKQLSGIEKRLLKLEQQVAQRARQEKLADCICSKLLAPTFRVNFRKDTGATFPQEFKKEMNRECPVHGFRPSGPIFTVNFVKPGETLTEDSNK